MNIYALSSGRGPSGIAIVRISGSETLKICQNLTKFKDIKVNYVVKNNVQAPINKGDKIGTLEVSRLESIWIKYQSDLEMVNEIVNKIPKL